eukprot:gnl/TRDRNA2_/TRDRNA2_68514_c0_seq2.p1 gnl/TRDRNA2_/TRDRNA2_68514_c0~~gnl/TRDRNA2_/TRDRNA2_68514_c0_seq2.p1  ORF type:complete len:319 (-),score=55.64 gnl/TRDRNA2_/TRDRNA2_68514_c0_seq2:197-1153(-)
MGFKKGRAARAAVAAETPTDTCLNVHHDGKCVTYTALSGSEYRIDVAAMQQLDVNTGTCRAVFRKPGVGKFWHWEFQAFTVGARNYTPPKCVAAALEECWQSQQPDDGESSTGARVNTHLHRTIQTLDDQALTGLVDLLKISETKADDAPLAECDDELRELARAATTDKIVQQVLADRLLQTTWPIEEVVCALRCFMRLGLRPTPAHCRTVAIGRGSLTLLRVLLVEANVDVCGLVLFEVAPSKRSQAAGNWVQRCKEALKALMARGAILGQHAPPSKLLRKVEEDGILLWTERALDGLTRAHPELPDAIVERVSAFL